MSDWEYGKGRCGKVEIKKDERGPRREETNLVGFEQQQNKVFESTKRKKS